MSGADRRSALVVAGEAEPVVHEVRRRYDRESVERGIPAHVTMLFPFLAASWLASERGRT